MRIFLKLDTENIVIGQIESIRCIGLQPEDPTVPEVIPIGYIEVTGRTDGPWIGRVYNSGTGLFSDYIPPAVPPAIVPISTQAQLKTALKTLLETDPAAWTADQQKQALYLLLYGLFRNLKTGEV